MLLTERYESIVKSGRQEDLLLDFHLGRLDPEERRRIEEELGRDAALRAKSDRLGGVLRPLDYWTIASAPPTLVEKVLLKVEQARQTESAVISGQEQGPTGGRGFRLSIRELLAVAACFIMLASVLVPALSEVRTRSQRVTCANHLSSIYQGVEAYRQEFAGALPFAGWVTGASWLPSGSKSRPHASNSQHVYRLLKGSYGPAPRDFVCPSSRAAQPVPGAELARYDDFAEAANISYATLNLASQSPNLRPPVPIAYISDANPLFLDGRFDETLDPSTANSPAHNGRGQTVLTLDGRVELLSSPIVGPRHDNLWLAGDVRHYSGTETQTRKDDAFLVPGYPSTDPRWNGNQGR